MSTSTGLNTLNIHKRSMRINKILFSKIKSRYELLKMRAAYIMAEDFIVNREIDEPDPLYDFDSGSSSTISTSLTPEEFNRLNKKPSEKELVHEQLLVLEKSLKEAEAEEDYKKCQTIMEAIKILRYKFTQL